ARRKPQDLSPLAVALLPPFHAMPSCPVDVAKSAAAFQQTRPEMALSRAALDLRKTSSCAGQRSTLPDVRNSQSSSESVELPGRALRRSRALPLAEFVAAQTHGPNSK